jgi:hypothetical protein
VYYVAGNEGEITFLDPSVDPLTESEVRGPVENDIDLQVAVMIVPGTSEPRLVGTETGHGRGSARHIRGDFLQAIIDQRTVRGTMSFTCWLRQLDQVVCCFADVGAVGYLSHRYCCHVISPFDQGDLLTHEWYRAPQHRVMRNSAQPQCLF